MKERYLAELLIMHKNAQHLCIQETKEAADKYEHVRKFLEKMITFLNVPSVDKVSQNHERVYNYMNFIINYYNTFRNKNGGSSQYREQVNQQPVHQPPSSQSKGPQLQPNGDMKLQYNLQPNLSQGVANLETNMVNFNQNFPSRRPQQARMPSLLNNSSFQMGIEQRPVNPLLIGSFKAAQPNVLSTTQQTNLGPKTSSVNMSGSPMGLLATTAATNFPSRQLNHQPALATQKFNSEKLKQPMHKTNELTESKVGQVMFPLGSRLLNQFHSPQFSLLSAAKSINQHAASPLCSWYSVSSPQVDANNVLSPHSIACSPFLLTSPSTPSHPEKRYFSGLSSLSTAESQNPETPIMPGQVGDQKTIENQVPDTGAPRTPTTLPMNAPCTEQSQESQDLKEPHLRLFEAVKSLSSKALSSSLIDICSVKKAINSIPDGEPTNLVGLDMDDEANFLLEHDNVRQRMINSIPDGQPTNLLGSNIEDEAGFLLEYENEPERKMRRKLSATSVYHSLRHFSDRDSFGQFVCEEWGMDSTVTSMTKRPKIEYKNGAILDEIKEINSKLLETSLDVVLDPAEDNISIPGGHEGTIVRCLYRSVCFPELLSLQGGASSETTPEFLIQLLVPVDYPASSPTIFNSIRNVWSSEPWAKLYEEAVSRFKRSLCGLPEHMSLGDMARNWDACARSVITELVQRRGGEHFSSTYGSWESCMNSSSGSN